MLSVTESPSGKDSRLHSHCAQRLQPASLLSQCPALLQLHSALPAQEGTPSQQWARLLGVVVRVGTPGRLASASHACGGQALIPAQAGPAHSPAQPRLVGGGFREMQVLKRVISQSVSPQPALLTPFPPTLLVLAPGPAPSCLQGCPTPLWLGPLAHVDEKRPGMVVLTKNQRFFWVHLA